MSFRLEGGSLRIVTKDMGGISGLRKRMTRRIIQKVSKTWSEDTKSQQKSWIQTNAHIKPRTEKKAKGQWTDEYN